MSMRELRYLIVGLLGWVALQPAAAQQTSCQWIGSTWRCNTQPDIWQQHRESMERQRQQQESFLKNLEAHRLRKNAQRQAEVQASHDASVAEVKGVVAHKLRTGDCAGALELALLMKDFELATQVKTFCSLPSPAPAPSEATSEAKPTP